MEFSLNLITGSSPANVHFTLFYPQGQQPSYTVMETEMTSIREVWSSNLKDELKHLHGFLLKGFKFITFDTEFPGFLRNAGKNASSEESFSNMRYNVNRMKLIQLGITISDDDGNVGGVWEFNFRDFDERKDDHDPQSIRMLKKQGINFDKLQKEGIALDDFGYRLKEIIRPNKDLSWVSFHGIYDVGYLIKLLTKTEIPESAEDFGALVGKVLGSVCDVKYMAGLCEGFQQVQIGLQRLARFLNVDRIGTTHCAGSDSLLAQSVFKMIIKWFNIPRESFEGFLYGFDLRILPVLWTQSAFEMMINTFHIPPDRFKGLLYALSFQIRPVDAGSDKLLTPLVFHAFVKPSDISPEFLKGYRYGLSFKILPDDGGSHSLLTQSVFEMMRNKFDITRERFEGFLYGLSFQILPVDAGSEISMADSVFELLINKLDISPALFDGFLYGLTFQIVPGFYFV